eukprot:TRINITY_DN445_c1_g1_i1.p1 TRINITY_DN445_c1_g1~~TRINITY_DN445_c1_g1_i1.p1  ORF type:complete len:749 (+),score=157.20 TRINITY_DN445_c1_g1_i1:38-2284(+)
MEGAHASHTQQAHEQGAPTTQPPALQQQQQQQQHPQHLAVQKARAQWQCLDPGTGAWHDYAPAAVNDRIDTYYMAQHHEVEVHLSTPHGQAPFRILFPKKLQINPRTGARRQVRRTRLMGTPSGAGAGTGAGGPPVVDEGQAPRIWAPEYFCDRPHQHLPSGFVPTLSLMESVLNLPEEWFQNWEKGPMTALGLWSVSGNTWRNGYPKLRLDPGRQEGMAVTVYSAESPVYTKVTAHMRQQLTEPRLLPFVYYLLRDIERIPPQPGVSFRGSKQSYCGQQAYCPNAVVVWPAVASTTKSALLALKDFASQGGVLFVVNGVSGRPIWPLCEFEDEEEILYPPNTRWKVKRILDEIHKDLFGRAFLKQQNGIAAMHGITVIELVEVSASTEEELAPSAIALELQKDIRSREGGAETCMSLTVMADRLLAAGKEEDGRSKLLRAVELEPNDFTANARLAILLHTTKNPNLKNLQAALGYYCTAMSHPPRTSNTNTNTNTNGGKKRLAALRSNYATLLYELKQHEEARVQLARALEETPEDSTLHRKLGTVLCNPPFRLYDEARLHLETAQLTSPYDGDLKRCLGELEVHCGNYARAREYYREALALEPNNEHTRVALIRLLRRHFRSTSGSSVVMTPQTPAPPPPPTATGIDHTPHPQHQWFAAPGAGTVGGGGGGTPAQYWAPPPPHPPPPLAQTPMSVDKQTEQQQWQPQPWPQQQQQQQQQAPSDPPGALPPPFAAWVQAQQPSNMQQ